MTAYKLRSFARYPHAADRMPSPRSLSITVNPCRKINLLHVREAAFRGARRFHVSAPTGDLVAPPDPVSHLRPIIYDDPPSQLPAPYLQHPYSLSEFKTETGTGTGPGDHDLQFRLLRQQLDSLHHNFWLDSNTRFYSARDAVLSSLPATATPRDKEEALSAFFRQWVMQEKEWTEGYTTEWRSRNFQLITLSARVEYQRLKAHLTNLFSTM